MSDFADYFPSTGGISLEGLVNLVFERLQILENDRAMIWAFLEPLRLKNDSTRFHYRHSLRVGLKCAEIARFLHIDEKALFYPGLLHDLGKLLVNPETLGKKDGWTIEDSREMISHVLDGYRTLRGCLDFTAEVIIWHHWFQLNGYPDVIPPPLHEYSRGTKVNIAYYGRLLALADCYDAFHRVNDKFGALTGEEIKTRMLESNPDQRHLVNELYEAGIFSTHLEGDACRETRRWSY